MGGYLERRRETHEVNHPSGRELWLYGSGNVDGGFAVDHAQFLLAVFDYIEFDSDDACDFDGAAERDLAVALLRILSALCLPK
jgi:hypothetical protein